MTSRMERLCGPPSMACHGTSASATGDIRSSWSSPCNQRPSYGLHSCSRPTSPRSTPTKRVRKSALPLIVRCQRLFILGSNHPPIAHSGLVPALNAASHELALLRDVPHREYTACSSARISFRPRNGPPFPGIARYLRLCSHRVAALVKSVSGRLQAANSTTPSACRPHRRQ